MSNALTVLLCESGYVACKKFLADGTVEPYSLGWRFEHFSYPVATIADLYAALSYLAKQSNAVVIRGAAKPGAPEVVRRTYLDKPDRPAYFEPCPRSWFCFDVDTNGPPVEDGDYQAAARQFILGLPEGLREASWVFQVSNSAHKSATLKGHFWGIASDPISDGLLREVCKRYGIDPSLANPVQPHFVANPIFESGSDPIAQRVYLLVGTQEFAEIHMSESRKIRDIAEDRLTKAAAKIRKAVAEGGGGRHYAVNKAAWSLGRLCPHVLAQDAVMVQLNAALDKCTDAVRREELQTELRRGIDDGIREPEYTRLDEWKALLSYTENGSALSTEANLYTLLLHAPEFAGRMAWDIRQNEMVWRDRPPWTLSPKATADQHAMALVQWCSANLRMTSLQSHMALRCLESVALQSPFDPVADYLESCEWDGVSRLADFATTHLKNDSQFAREAFKAQLIAAVRRVYEPGCQADYILAFRGRGGVGKSTFTEWLGGRFHASVSAKVGDKDSVVNIQSSWIVEFGEASSFSRREVEAVKEYITCRTDNIRLPYARRATQLPRRCAFFATMNPSVIEDWILDEAHGRRFRIIDIPGNIRSGLTVELRDQLWAEALVCYRRGDTSWELSTPALEQANALTEAASESSHDPWLDLLETPDGWEGKTTSAIWDRLQVPSERRTNTLKRRIYRCMAQLGYRPRPTVRGTYAAWERIPAYLR